MIGFKKLTGGMVLLLVCGLSMSPTVAQQTSSPRTQPPAVIEYNGDLATMLATLSKIYGATIGLEVDAQQPQSQVAFHLRDPSLPDVLNAIVKSAPSYQWRESDGCFEVFPAAGSSPLLDTLIRNFRANDIDEEAAINQLLGVPEMQSNMRAMNLSRRAPGSTSTDMQGKNFSVNLDAATLRQALNKIANDSGGRFWIFRNYRDGFFSISNFP
jgi:hypothetical protein